MQSGRDLLTALTMTGVKVARARFRLSRGTWEPVVTMSREMPKWKNHEDKVPMRGTGADQPVVASKPGNAGGAKGLNGSAEGMDQPEMGGIHAGSEVVRRGPRDGQESTSDGRNRCLKRSLTRFPNRWSGKRTRRSRRTTERPGWTGRRSRRSRRT